MKYLTFGPKLILLAFIFNLTINERDARAYKAPVMKKNIDLMHYIYSILNDSQFRALTNEQKLFVFTNIYAMLDKYFEKD